MISGSRVKVSFWSVQNTYNEEDVVSLDLIKV